MLLRGKKFKDPKLKIVSGPHGHVHWDTLFKVYIEETNTKLHQLRQTINKIH